MVCAAPAATNVKSSRLHANRQRRKPTIASNGKQAFEPLTSAVPCRGQNDKWGKVIQRPASSIDRPPQIPDADRHYRRTVAWHTALDY
jgi:hypothetical protein